LDLHEFVAREALLDETNRTRAGFTGVKDPAASSSRAPSLEEGDIRALREKFPFLKDFSDSFIRSTRYSELLKTETTAIKISEFEKGRAASSRLAVNRDKLQSSFTLVKEGKDNRWDRLHDSRFLAGAGCLASKLWLKARKVIGSGGQVPIGTYDMNSIGLGGFVSKKGWVELHDPGSDLLSLRLFNINNCGQKAASSSANESDPTMKDILDLGEFKLALRVAREAQAFVQPWNKSIAALDGFLHQRDFCKSDLVGEDKPALILTQFSDYVMGENANRWRAQEPFLSTGDLKGAWESFFGARPSSNLKNRSQVSGGSGQKGKVQKPGGQGQGISKVPGYFDDICNTYNTGRCVKAPGQCATKAGVSLRHVCNFRADLSKPALVCGKSHPRIFNH